MRHVYPESDPLRKEKQEVFDRMMGCGDKDCHACTENYQVIENLVIGAQKPENKIRPPEDGKHKMVGHPNDHLEM